MSRRRFSGASLCIRLVPAGWQLVLRNYLYENGEFVESDGGYQLVTVAGKTYVVNDRGKIKKSGTFTDDDDICWMVQERVDRLGYEIIRKG